MPRVYEDSLWFKFSTLHLLHICLFLSIKLQSKKKTVLLSLLILVIIKDACGLYYNGIIPRTDAQTKI